MRKKSDAAWRKRQFVVSCQQVAISFAFASTSATATIAAVDTTRSWIVWGGLTTPSNASQNTCIRLALTDSTTVTATRTAASSAPTVKATVVHATGYLVRSVQSGTITLAGTSATATISSVDTSRSVVFFSGATSTASSNNLADSRFALTLTNATTVTATAAASSTGTVGYTVVEFAPEAVSSVQAGTTVGSANTNLSATLALAPNAPAAATALINQGELAASNNPGEAAQRAAWTDDATITVNRTIAGTASVWGRSLASVTFRPGVLRAVARGTIALSAATSGTATIPAVDLARTWLSSLGNDAANAAALSAAFAAVALTDSATVTATVNSAATMNVSWEAISFN